MAPRRTSGVAIASLICGILGCIPLVTSIAAVILGIVGIKQTANPARSGRGMAIGGLILGLLGIGGWTLFGGGMFWGLSKAKEMAAQTATPFVQAVIDGDYQKASQYTSLSEAELRTLNAQMQGWGDLNDFSIAGFSGQKNAGQAGRMVLNGNATFANAGKKDVEVVLEAQGEQFKIIGIHFK